MMIEGGILSAFANGTECAFSYPLLTWQAPQKPIPEGQGRGHTKVEGDAWRYAMGGSAKSPHAFAHKEAH